MQTLATCFSYQRKTFLRCSIVKYTVSFRRTGQEERKERGEDQGFSSSPPRRRLLPRSTRTPSGNCSLSLDLLRVYPICRFLQETSLDRWSIGFAKPIYRFLFPPCFCFRRVYGNFQCVPSDEKKKEEEEERRRQGMEKKKDPRFSSRE